MPKRRTDPRRTCRFHTHLAVPVATVTNEAAVALATSSILQPCMPKTVMFEPFLYRSCVTTPGRAFGASLECGKQHGPSTQHLKFSTHVRNHEKNGRCGQLLLEPGLGQFRLSIVSWASCQPSRSCRCRILPCCSAPRTSTIVRRATAESNRSGGMH